jgi:hypothetical protein
MQRHESGAVAGFSVSGVGNSSLASTRLALDWINLPIWLRRLLDRWKAGAIAGRAPMLIDFRRQLHLDLSGRLGGQPPPRQFNRRNNRPHGDGAGSSNPIGFHSSGSDQY